MPKIKFSHNYPKLWNQTAAELLAVKEIRIDKNTHPDLIEYDTKAVNGEYFKLNTGNHIQLIFLGNKGIPFCTIRSAFPETKVAYYKSLIGKILDIEIKEI